ncbi:MAG: aldo/keto reductase [Anaerolineales bacterium]|nr:aldo/keto reductase [Anaerolineales bacterium]
MSSNPVSTSTIKLSNGISMPRLGLGTWRSSEDSEVRNSVQLALENGYRLIDTAFIYGNETSIGKALKTSSVPREDIFITTKVWNSDQGYEKTLKAFEISAGNLQLEQIDLYLIHWPVSGLFTETWRAMEDLYQAGRIRAIGVSNFLPEHLEELTSSARILPVVNQIEFHPYLQSPELVAACAELGILIEAWAPLMEGGVVDVPELREIGKRHGKTPAQVSLRWMFQKDVIVIPKSTHKKWIIENASIFDFTLSEQEIAVLDSLDRGKRLGPDPANFDF